MNAAHSPGATRDPGGGKRRCAALCPAANRAALADCALHHRDAWHRPLHGRLPKGLPFKSTVINFHKSLGMTVFLLVLIRIMARMAYGRPPLPPMRAWQRAAASTTQGLLYVGMVAMPLTGYLGSSFNKFGTKFWGSVLPKWGWDDAQLRHVFFTVHGVIAWTMIVLIALHFAGAMKHQFIDRDGLLRRMLP